MKKLLYVCSLLMPGALLLVGLFYPYLYGVKELSISFQLFAPTLISTVIGTLLCTLPSVPRVLKIAGLCLNIGGATAFFLLGIFVVLTFGPYFIPLALIPFAVSLPFYIVAITQSKAIREVRH